MLRNKLLKALLGAEGGKASFHSALPFFYWTTKREPCRARRNKKGFNTLYTSRCKSFLVPVLAVLIAGFLAYPARGEPVSLLPVIERLDSRDTIFRQYLSDVESARRLIFSSRQKNAEELVSSLTVYSYTPSGEEFFAIAARCNIPYCSLASLNRFSHTEDMLPGKSLLLPSMPGLFVPEIPGSDLEKLLFSSREDDQDRSVVVSIPREGKTERFRFIPGEDFSSNERVFFLNRGFHFPLQQFHVSSSYGPRINPVTGKPGIHKGLDFAAPEGSPVYAVKNGTVVDLGEDPVLGKYVILSHENNWVSFYGHLSVINTALRTEVQSGSLIAGVGSTGQSTGPHLHFELRQNGQSRDPTRLLGLFKGMTGR